MNIFISYSSKDRALAESLADDLVALGHDVWFDQQLTGGRLWWDTILDHIRSADLFVFVLTPRGLNSSPCKLEYGYAESLGKRVLPVLVEDVNVLLLPPALSTLQFVDYRQRDTRAAVLSLNRALQHLPPAEPLPDPLPPPPPPPISPLGRLKEQIDAPTLSFSDQAGLLLELSELMDEDTANAGAARALLEQLRERDDVYAKVAREIDELLNQQQAAPPAPPVSTPAPAPQPVYTPAAPPDPAPVPVRAQAPAGSIPFVPIVIVLLASLALIAVALNQFSNRQGAVPMPTQDASQLSQLPVDQSLSQADADSTATAISQQPASQQIDPGQQMSHSTTSESIFFVSTIEQVSTIYRVDSEGTRTAFYTSDQDNLITSLALIDSTLYTASHEDTKINRLDDGVITTVYEHDGVVESITADQDGKLYFSDLHEGNAPGTIYRLEDHEAVPFYEVQFNEDFNWTGYFEFDANNTLWLTAYDGSNGFLYRVVGDEAPEMPYSNDTGMWGFMFAPDGHIVYTAGSTIHHLDLDTGTDETLLDDWTLGQISDVAVREPDA